LRLAGLMAVAPQAEDPAAAFARLRELSAALRREHPEAVEISAGMSADLADAIRWGSTRVRVGSAIMGPRPRG
ncbi:alanine racemase, partial [Amycolatopsis sp. H6(2020)]|nr:alanine racemase [Amycolatopsis sp. H6(2020)]